MNREEFEISTNQKLQIVISQSKQIRELLRKLEEEIANKEEKIKNYHQSFLELEQQLVKIQTIIYAKGTT